MNLDQLQKKLYNAPLLSSISEELQLVFFSFLQMLKKKQ